MDKDTDKDKDTDIMKPLNSGYTIYSKSGCGYCTKVKNLLSEKKLFFFEIYCDDYLIEDKPAFLLLIKELAFIEVKTFPIVFNDGKFIGGYNETKEYIEKQSVSFNENTDF